MNFDFYSKAKTSNDFFECVKQSSKYILIDFLFHDH